MANGGVGKGNEDCEAHQKKGFRLTPEEQELAYRRKANTMQRLQVQNLALAAELGMLATVRDIRRKQKRACQSRRKYDEEMISRINAVKLMRVYEKRAKEANNRMHDIQAELDETLNLAQRYRRLYRETKEQNQALPVEVQHQQTTRGSKRIASARHSHSQPMKDDVAGELAANPHERLAMVAEDDLDDDEARVTRHIARIRESKGVRSCSIRVEDIIRKNETLLTHNNFMGQEIQRLRRDNSELTRSSKHASDNRQYLMNAVHTSEMARRELTKRLDAQLEQNQRTQQCITKQTAGRVNKQRHIQFSEELDRCNNVRRVSVLAAQERTYVHSVRKNINDPRSMFPTESYAAPEYAN